MGVYPAQQGYSTLETFAVTMLSNAEQALRDSSNTKAPLECWGCTGVYKDNNHLHKDCPHKHMAEVQRRFKVKLEECLAKCRQSRFNPQTYKRDGFLTKKAATMFNSICSEDLDGTARQELIASFVAECNANGTVRRSNRNASGTVSQLLIGSGTQSSPEP